ncbi:hypothetical protein AOLI_G00176380 [Acnodon oligacanthus]
MTTFKPHSRVTQGIVSDRFAGWREPLGQLAAAPSADGGDVRRGRDVEARPGPGFAPQTALRHLQRKHEYESSGKPICASAPPGATVRYAVFRTPQRDKHTQTGLHDDGGWTDRERRTHRTEAKKVSSISSPLNSRDKQASARQGRDQKADKASIHPASQGGSIMFPRCSPSARLVRTNPVEVERSASEHIQPAEICPAARWTPDSGRNGGEDAGLQRAGW